MLGRGVCCLLESCVYPLYRGRRVDEGLEVGPLGPLWGVWVLHAVAVGAPPVGRGRRAPGNAGIAHGGTWNNLLPHEGLINCTSQVICWCKDVN